MSAKNRETIIQGPDRRLICSAAGKKVCVHDFGRFTREAVPLAIHMTL